MSNSKLLTSIKNGLHKYRYLLLGTLIVAIFGLTVWRIETLSSPARDEAAYNEALSTVERVTIDEAVVEKIVNLRDASVEVDPQFPGNRENPFE